MAPIVRTALVGLGVLFMLAGLATIVAMPETGVAGLWTVGIGAFLVVVPLLERQRYRSEAAEKAREAPGPGGGESSGGALEPRFRPTAEVFVGPPTGPRM